MVSQIQVSENKVHQNQYNLNHDLNNDEGRQLNGESETDSEQISVNQKVVNTSKTKEFVFPNLKRCAKKTKLTEDPDECSVYGKHL
ncbi:hypothetical protein ABEB36_014262, partial [Hypothenemus hampei]